MGWEESNGTGDIELLEPTLPLALPAQCVCRQGDQGHSGTMTVGPQKSPAEGEEGSPGETSLPLLSNL